VESGGAVKTRGRPRESKGVESRGVKKKTGGLFRRGGRGGGLGKEGKKGGEGVALRGGRDDRWKGSAEVHNKGPETWRGTFPLAW